MQAGTSTIHSRMNIKNNFTVNDDALTIDTSGNIITSGVLTINNLNGANRINNELIINSGLSSDNKKIILDINGNLTLHGNIYAKDDVKFTNSIDLVDNSLNSFLKFNTNIDNYINLSNNQKLGIGTSRPTEFFHVNGNCLLGKKAAGANEGSIVYVQDKMTINKTGFSTNLASTADSSTLNVGGDINISGSLYLGGEEISKQQIDNIRNELEILVNRSDNSDNSQTNNTSITGSSLWTVTNTGLIYYDKGNVGIGVNNPAYQLHTEGNAYIGGNGGKVILGDNKSKVYLGSTLITDLVNGYWETEENNSKNIYTAFYTDNNVGIGIKTPKYKLDITGTLHVTDNVFFDNNVYINKNVGIGTTSPEYLLDVNGDVNIEGKLIIDGVVYKPPSDTLNVFWIQDAELDIYYLNNVGIGIINPSYQLHVKGDSYFDGTTFFNGNTVITTLDIQVNFSVGDDLFVINNSKKLVDIKERVYCNNITGDTLNYSFISIDDDSYYQFHPSNLISQQVTVSNNDINGIGLTSNSMTFSNDGNLFAVVVPFGSKTFETGNSTINATNGIVQTYEWDSVNKIWCFLNYAGINTGSSNINNYINSISINSNGKFLAVAYKNININNKINFFTLINGSWTNASTLPIEIINSDSTNAKHAGKFVIMEDKCNYLITNKDNHTLALYKNSGNSDNSYNTEFEEINMNSVNSEYAKNIGRIQDLKSNNNCSIFIVSSNEGVDFQNNGIYNGTFACYALWQSNGNTSINSTTPFYRLGKIIDEQNGDSSVNSNFGFVCSISNKANIDFGTTANYKNFKYSVTVAIGTKGKVQKNKTNSYIKIYSFTPNIDNTSNGLNFDDTTDPYVDGVWELIGNINGSIYGSNIGFGESIKLNDSGNELYVGSPNNNDIFIFKYKPDSSPSWVLLNKIQGYRSGDIGLGYNIEFNMDHNIFASTNCYAIDYDNDYDIYTINYRNNIRFYNIESQSSTSVG